MAVTGAAVLRGLVRDHEVIAHGCDERPLSALLARALNELPSIAAGLGLPSGLSFRDGSNRQPDVLGVETDGEFVKCLVEVKTGTNNFNWSNVDGRSQLEGYRTRYQKQVRYRENRLVIMPQTRVDKLIDKSGRQSVNIPYPELKKWTVKSWESIGDLLDQAVSQADKRSAASSLEVFKTALRVK
jgi:hypothetical protein